MNGKQCRLLIVALYLVDTIYSGMADSIPRVYKVAKFVVTFLHNN